jgi:hypothetical protein
VCAVITVVALASGVGVGVALAVSVTVGVAVAVGVDFGIRPSSVFRLCPLAQTINARRAIPTTTAKTTRPEGPGFFADNGAGAGRGILTGAGAGTVLTSIRGVREREETGTGGTINLSKGLASLLTGFFRAALFFTVDFLVADFLTVTFLATLFLLADFFAVDFFFAADFLEADFFAAVLFATDFLAVAFFTATVTPWVSVRTSRNAHYGRRLPQPP